MRAVDGSAVTATRPADHGRASAAATMTMLVVPAVTTVRIAIGAPGDIVT